MDESKKKLLGKLDNILNWMKIKIQLVKICEHSQSSIIGKFIALNDCIGEERLNPEWAGERK